VVGLVYVYVGNERDPGAALDDTSMRKHLFSQDLTSLRGPSALVSLFSNTVLLSTLRYIRSGRHEMRSSFLGLATLCDSFSEGNLRVFVLAGAVWKRKGG
jgi:hypothetical protein